MPEEWQMSAGRARRGQRTKWKQMINQQMSDEKEKEKRKTKQPKRRWNRITLSLSTASFVRFACLVTGRQNNARTVRHVRIAFHFGCSSRFQRCTVSASFQSLRFRQIENRKQSFEWIDCISSKLLLPPTSFSLKLLLVSLVKRFSACPNITVWSNL